MRSLIRKQSRKSHISRLSGGRPLRKTNTHYLVSYAVTCNPNISVADLFSMANTGLYEMATGHGDVPITSVNDMTVSQSVTHIENLYIVQFIVEFSDESDSSDFKESYLNAIENKPLFKNGSFVPVKTSFRINPK